MPLFVSKNDEAVFFIYLSFQYYPSKHYIQAHSSNNFSIARLRVNETLSVPNKTSEFSMNTRMHLTPSQTDFIKQFPSEQFDEIFKAISQGCLFAEVVVCDLGQYSTGSMEDDSGKSLPCLSLFKEDIEKVIAGMEEEYRLQISKGERDEDDVWEGQLMRAVWHQDDTLSFFSACDERCEIELSRQSLSACCGN